MGMCPRYNLRMQVDSDQMVCDSCGYHYTVPKRIPSQEELLRENERLGEFIEKLLTDTSPSTPHNAQD